MKQKRDNSSVLTYLSTLETFETVSIAHFFFNPLVAGVCPLKGHTYSNKPAPESCMFA